jgi:hypothetical protein
MIFDRTILTFFVFLDALRLPYFRNCELYLSARISLVETRKYDYTWTVIRFIGLA